MASNKVRPTPPPGGPALVRPALGALLLGLSGVACNSDDGNYDSDTNASQPPMTVSEEGPMPNPTTDGDTSLPPMIPPTTSTGESADSDTSGGDTTIPPMVPPDTTTTDGSSSDSGSGSGSESGSTGPIPPMPPPDGGAAPEDQEI